MVTGSTQQPEGAGKPSVPAVQERVSGEGWSMTESGHKELMRLEDRDPDLAREAVPTPPGDTNRPPPGKDARTGGNEQPKAGGTDQAKGGGSEQSSTPQGANQAQTQAGTKPDAKTAKDERAAKAPVPAPRPVSDAKVKMKERLPALPDDGDVGREKEQTVARDGKADLGFTGTLLGSAASSAPKGLWQELRIYSTTTGKHVFSKITRTVYADENDQHEADVFDPSPSSVPSQLLRSAREITRSRPMTWMDAAVAFFGYDPLAKVLYRKLSVQFEERV